MAKEANIDRLMVEVRVIDLFRDLTLKSTKGAIISSQPFQELKDAFLWAMALGVKSGKRRPLEGSREMLLRWEYLSGDEKRSLAMIALAETEDVNIITDVGSIQEVAEEYANEGIRIIKREIKDGAGDPLWKLVSFARSSVEE